MSRESWRLSVRGFRLVTILATLVVLGGPVIGAAQQAATGQGPVTRVEEDWLLWVYQPDGEANCPQLHTVMSPLGGLDSQYFMVTWNYWELPTFSPGGFQVQSCQGNEVLQTNSIDANELSLWAETITWTQVLETDGSQLGFSIINGQSLTWGSFGYPETTIVGDSGIADLSGYSPDVSVAHSSITYGKNRVITLMISEVRYYGAQGLIATDATPQYVYQLGSGN